MEIRVHPSWEKVLSDEFNKPYFKDLWSKVEEEYRTYVCYPPKELIFNALNHCSFDDIKVVILGQDPYHGKGEANGLSFSVNDDIAIPPSLRNIFREINSDFDTIFFPATGNLERWADQGVLLLNTALTVRENSPNSHKHIAWNKFTDAVIHKISEEKENVVFLLWGSHAIKKVKLINTEKHYILESGHPSPLSANRGMWFGNKHFSKTNAYLNQIGKSDIKW